MAKGKKGKQDQQVDANDEDAQRAAAERKAREANAARNTERVNRMNAIADNADQIKTEEEDLEDLTDEVWDQGDPNNSGRKTREQQLADQEAAEQRQDADDEQAQRLREARGNDEDEPENKNKVIRQAEAEDRDADTARDAGAEDVRKNAGGETEYKLVVNGKTRWLTLGQLRQSAGKVESADEYLQDAKDGVTRGSPQGGATEDEQARTQAAATAKAYKDRLKDLYTKASMGDEEAIDQLAEINAGLSRVTPDVLRIVDERVDARVQGRTEFDSAVDWFEGEYEAELATPRLKAYAARLDRERAEANPDMPVRDRLKAVGDELRQMRQDLGGPPGNGGPTKQQRKEQMRQVPSAAGRQRQGDDEGEGESTQDAIREMARTRGQARAIKH